MVERQERTRTRSLLGTRVASGRAQRRKLPCFGDVPRLQQGVTLGFRNTDLVSCLNFFFFLIPPHLLPLELGACQGLSQGSSTGEEAA